MHCVAPLHPHPYQLNMRWKHICVSIILKCTLRILDFECRSSLHELKYYILCDLRSERFWARISELAPKTENLKPQDLAWSDAKAVIVAIAQVPVCTPTLNGISYFACCITVDWVSARFSRVLWSSHQGSAVSVMGSRAKVVCVTLMVLVPLRNALSNWTICTESASFRHFNEPPSAFIVP